jgi:hypothetical protein
MKKGIYWFAKLSEKEQNEFRENCKNQDDNFHTQMEWECDTFYVFIAGAFVWGNTIQSSQYWNTIANRKES